MLTMSSVSFLRALLDETFCFDPDTATSTSFVMFGILQGQDERPKSILPAMLDQTAEKQVSVGRRVKSSAPRAPAARSADQTLDFRAVPSLRHGNASQLETPERRRAGRN